MPFEGLIFRPPSEANSILLQITRGCSHNKCTFCGMYKDSTFIIKSKKEIVDDLHSFAHTSKNQSSLFFCDGDALSAPFDLILETLIEIKKITPWIRKISTYASVQSLAGKTDTQLLQLQQNGLTMIHLGLESGDDQTLQSCNKCGSADDFMIHTLRAKKSNIKLFLTILLGLGGKNRSHIHAVKTGELLSIIDPHFVGALTLMLVPGTFLHDKFLNNDFDLPDSFEILQELKTLIHYTNLSHGVLYSNHASNYLPLKIRFPGDKQKALQIISDALNGRHTLRPDFIRGL